MNRNIRRNGGLAPKAVKASDPVPVIGTPYFAIVVKDSAKAESFAKTVAECHADRLGLDRKIGRRLSESEFKAMRTAFVSKFVD